MSELKIWCNVPFENNLRWQLERAVKPHQIIWASSAGESNLVAGASDPAALEADVLFGQPAVEDVLASDHLKWMHITSAGYTRYDRDDVRSRLKGIKALFTNSSSVYDEPCALHLLAFLLAETRGLYNCFRSQQERKWDYSAHRPTMRVLEGDRILIVGFGAIARRFVELLQPFDVEINAVRRTVKGDEGVTTYTIDQLDDYLPWADHVVNILPASPSTEQKFGKLQFRLMQPGASFYNVGRGDTVDQEALLETLNSGRLKTAYLDVTTPEPLPEDHPLWTHPNCFITPHIAGGVQDEDARLLDHFVSNLRRFSRGTTPKDIVF
jgi:phosphoglycerate dehydrogenase-like enzyme